MSKNNDYDNISLLNKFLEHLVSIEEKKNNTISSYYYDLVNFHEWCGERAFSTINHDDIVEYLEGRTEELANSSIRRLITSLKLFFSYLVVNNYQSTNPLAKISLPKKVATQPLCLNEEEVEQIFNQIDLNSKIGKRDRAMLELTYSSGLRASEVVNLLFDEINFQRALIRVYGKGGKTRYVPISHRALYYLNYYLSEVRYQYDVDSDYVFTNSKGKPMTRTNFYLRIMKYAEGLNINLKGFGPHTLRHSFATSMLNNGADIRSVQTLLGHSSLVTTQVYTHLANEQIANLYHDNLPKQALPYKDLLVNLELNYQDFLDRKYR